MKLTTRCRIGIVAATFTALIPLSISGFAQERIGASASTPLPQPLSLKGSFGVVNAESPVMPLDAKREPLQTTPRGQSQPLVPIPNRFFVGFDGFGLFPHQRALTATIVQPRFGEVMTSAVTYSALPTANAAMPTLDVVLGHEMVIGVRVLTSEFTTQRVGIAVQVPHPTLPNTYGSASAGRTFNRRDTSIDVTVAYQKSGPKWVSKAAIGPSYFNVKHELVSQIDFSQSATALGGNTIHITTVPMREESGSGWGVNFGGDVSYFAWQHIGVGGGMFFSYGRVKLDDPYTGGTARIYAGSTTLQGGMRFRF